MPISHERRLEPSRRLIRSAAGLALLGLLAGVSGAAPAGAESFPPRFVVASWPEDGVSNIFGQDWTPGAALTVTLDHAATVESPDLVDTSIQVDENGFFNQWGWAAELQAGDVIVVSDGAATSTLRLLDPKLELTAVDLDADTVSGTAAPGSSLSVLAGATWPEGGPSNTFVLPGVADETGAWTVDFTGTLDLRSGAGLAAQQDDPDNPFATYWVVRKLAGLPMPQSKDDCKRAGWRDLVDGSGTPFRSQGDCVRFVTTSRS